MQDPRWKIKEKFVGKCFPIFSRAAVPRRQPDASEGAKNRLTVFTFASDPRFQESTKIARERRPCDGRRSSTIVQGLANFKLIVYFENPAISIFYWKWEDGNAFSLWYKADSSHLIFADQKFIRSNQKRTFGNRHFKSSLDIFFSGSYRLKKPSVHENARVHDIWKQRNIIMENSMCHRHGILKAKLIASINLLHAFLTSWKMPIFRDSGFWKQTT